MKELERLWEELSKYKEEAANKITEILQTEGRIQQLLKDVDEGLSSLTHTLELLKKEYLNEKELNF